MSYENEVQTSPLQAMSHCFQICSAFFFFIFQLGPCGAWYFSSNVLVLPPHDGLYSHSSCNKVKPVQITWYFQEFLD